MHVVIVCVEVETRHGIGGRLREQKRKDEEEEKKDAAKFEEE